MIDDGITRRTVLRSVATAGAAAVATGTAAGEKGPQARIVGTDSPHAERAAKAQAESVKRVLDFGDIGKAVAGRFSDKAAEQLSNRPDVRYVEEDGTMEALAQRLPWGVDRVDADVVHANGETGSGADIAIIDTGIDSNHPDLQANLGTGHAVVSSRGPYAEKWDDDNGHGTHCAGIADAFDNSEGVVGVSTAATLHAVKVLDNGGSGSFSDVAEGIRWVADQNYDVGSMSLGATSGSQTVRDACRYADDNDVLLVASAGNSGPCTDCVGYPAAYSTVMAVTSTTQSDSLSSFSSTGPEVDLAAPGSGIYSTYAGGGYETLSGTSMACPHVSGAAGQLMANGYTNTEARSQLKSTAEDIGLASNESGAGLLDVEAAVGTSSGDSAPSVSWVNPGDSTTVSGTVTVQIAANDDEDSTGSLNVDWILGSSSRDTTYDSEAGYYEDSWDTTGTDDGSYDILAEATDSAGNTTTKTITVSVDNTENAPAVDTLSASEVETSDGDAEFDVDWSVSDSDGNLSSVDLTLTDDTDSRTEDTASVSVSGSSASATTRLVAPGDDGSGNSYTVDVTVTDGAGKTGSGSTSVSETEDTNADPIASIDSLNDKSNPRWNRYEVDWSVNDSDGNLDTVKIEMRDSSGSLDTVTIDVSGSSASGVDEVRSGSNGTEIVVTATDTDGASDFDSRSI